MRIVGKDVEMVKLVNWSKATELELNIGIGDIIKETEADVVLIPLGHKRLVEYIKSSDLDTSEPMIIRLEYSRSLIKEIERLKREGFLITVVIPNPNLSENKGKSLTTKK